MRILRPTVAFKGSEGFLTGNSAQVQSVLKRGIFCYNKNNVVINATSLFLEKYWLSRSMNYEWVGRDDTPSTPSSADAVIAEAAAKTKGRRPLQTKFEWAPFPRIPNVAKFIIKDNGYDELLRMFNLDKKLPRSFEYEPYNNGPRIRYAKRQISYLRRLAANGRYDVYWRTAMFLMKHSYVFQLMALYKCYPNFHRNLSLKTVYAILDEFRRVVSENDWSLKYKRVYIPKNASEDKWRPLGVPTPV